MDNNFLIALVCMVILAGLVAFLVLQIFAFQELKPNQIIYAKNMGGQIVDAFMARNSDFHINHPDYGCYDDRFDLYELLPNKWGKPEDMDPMTLKWKNSAVDSKIFGPTDETERRLAEKKLLELVVESLKKTISIAREQISNLSLISTISATERKNLEHELVGTISLKTIELTNTESELEKYSDLIDFPTEIKTYHLTDRLNLFGYYFLGFYPFRTRYTYKISYQKLESLDYTPKPNEQVLYTGAQFQIIVIKNDTSDHVRINSEIPVPFVNIETGKTVIKEDSATTDGALEKKFEGIESISMEGIVNQAVRPTNVMRVLNSNQTGLTALVTSGTIGVVKEVYGNSNYDSIIKSKDETGQDGSIVHLMSILNIDTTNNGGNPGYPEMYGFGFNKTTVLEVDASAGSKKFLEAAQEEAIQKKLAAAKLAKADGDAGAIKKIRNAQAESDADYIEKTGKADNEIIADRKVHPDIARNAQALENTKIGTLVLGNGANPLVTNTVQTGPTLRMLPELDQYILEPKKEEKVEEKKEETTKDSDKKDTSDDKKTSPKSSNNQNQRKNHNHHNKKKR